MGFLDPRSDLLLFTAITELSSSCSFLKRGLFIYLLPQKRIMDLGAYMGARHLCIPPPVLSPREGETLIFLMETNLFLHKGFIYIRRIRLLSLGRKFHSNSHSLGQNSAPWLSLTPRQPVFPRGNL